MDLVLTAKKDYIERMFIELYQNIWREGTYEYKKRKTNMRVLYIERFVYENIIQNHKFNLYEKYCKCFRYIQNQFNKYITFCISDFNKNILCWE